MYILQVVSGQKVKEPRGRERLKQRQRDSESEYQRERETETSERVSEREREGERESCHCVTQCVSSTFGECMPERKEKMYNLKWIKLTPD